jgi:hypothetical protein
LIESELALQEMATRLEKEPSLRPQPAADARSALRASMKQLEAGRLGATADNEWRMHDWIDLTIAVLKVVTVLGPHAFFALGLGKIRSQRGPLKTLGIKRRLMSQLKGA